MEDELEIYESVDVYVDEQAGKVITIPIVDEIGPPAKYNDVVYYLRGAQPPDRVEILINSPGGRIDGALHIISAINQCAAHEIHATITGECASAATFIFFSALSWEVPEFATMLLHSSSYFAGGLTPHVFQLADHEKKHLKQLCDIFYSGFLTKKEVKDLLRGDQLYFMSSEIGTRLDRRIKLLTKQQEE